MKVSSGLMYVGGIAAGLLLAKMCLGGTCSADTRCGATGCGQPINAGLCQCCSRGGNGNECCPASCANCALPITPGAPPPNGLDGPRKLTPCDKRDLPNWSRGL